MDQQLWKNILDFDLDGTLTEYGFSTKLGNEHFWPVNFARDAIIEYKKFMYLAAVSDSMVAPSAIVDVVWHQHLIFTQSYERFCSVLGKKIAHIPSTHNKAEFDKFKSAAERTKRLYVENFGAQPAEFWDYDEIYESLAMPQSAFTVMKVAGVGALLLLPLLIVAYFCLRPLYVTIDNPDFVIDYVALVVICVICLQVYNRFRLSQMVNGWPKDACVFNFSALELVYLRKNDVRDVINGVVNQLILSDKISISPDNTITLNDPAGAESPMELCVLEAVKERTEVYYRTLLSILELKPAFNKTKRAMDMFRAYVTGSVLFLKLFTLNFALLSVLFSLGAVRLATGILRDKPVTIIAIIVVVCLFVALGRLYYLTTSIGSVVLPGFYKRNILPEKSIEEDWEWNYFLLGSAVFAASFAPLVSYATNNGGGGGDSGSSCGSGCGGGGSSCGGCGGN